MPDFPYPPRKKNPHSAEMFKVYIRAPWEPSTIKVFPEYS